MSEKEITAEERQLWRYWTNWIRRSKKKHPTKDWEAAKKALLGPENIEEVEKLDAVSGYRLQYESLKSFLDQVEPTFQVTPPDAYSDDPLAGKQAECDFAYLRYIWNEQKCQTAQAEKLDSALIRNMGYTLVGFDKKKWMPTVTYLPAKNVFLDPDFSGVRDRDNAIGYQEEISIEELRARHSHLSNDDITIIAKNGGSVLTEEQLKESNPEDLKLYKTVIIYHIYARNDAAIRKHTEGEEDEIPEKSLVEELNLTVPKRYLQFVRGYHAPLTDTDSWPYDLDDDEFPITPLSFNKVTESLYGFTDHKQMLRSDLLCNAIFRDMEKAAFWAGQKKFGGSGMAGDLEEAKVDAFLNSTNKCYIPGILESNGEPKIREIQVGQFSPELVNAYKVSDEARTKASAIGELLHTEAKDFKDVTALAASIHDANVHQRVNRRLGGSEGYEMSIAQDAIKVLEIAHQMVPKLSVIEVEVPQIVVGPEGELINTSETTFEYLTLPWQQALQTLQKPSAKLIQLGADSIVGQELVEYWRTSDEYPLKAFKLSTRIRVLPGSTRSITKEQKAAMLKQFYLEVFMPLYQATNRWDLAVAFIGKIGQTAGISNIDDYLPKKDDMQRFMQEQKQLEQQQILQGQRA